MEKEQVVGQVVSHALKEMDKENDKSISLATGNLTFLLKNCGVFFKSRRKNIEEKIFII